MGAQWLEELWGPSMQVLPGKFVLNVVRRGASKGESKTLVGMGWLRQSVGWVARSETHQKGLASL